MKDHDKQVSAFQIQDQNIQRIPEMRCLSNILKQQKVIFGLIYECVL